MRWEILFHDEFEQEFDKFGTIMRKRLVVMAGLLERHGPNLGRPYADHLHGSKHTNMKELRFEADGGVWRVAFVFDPERKAILLIAGDKRGINQKRFYKHLIREADERFDRHLAKQKRKI
ncbi:MAG: type II toxin-antitoxin system RelE/ParE family toxin [Pseudomonadota bacterium]